MRVGPDLSQYGSELPELGELLPEEIHYLCDVCKWLAELRICQLKRLTDSQIEQLSDRFDADELGIDPEEDYERA